MGKSKIDYVIISGLNFGSDNRGTAALGYGAFSFLNKKHQLNKNDHILRFNFFVNPFGYKWWSINSAELNVQGNTYIQDTLNVHHIEKFIFDKFNILLPFTKFGAIWKKVKYVAAINGGDGFSDIYNTLTFKYRLTETLFAMKTNTPLILLPQTIGPFSIDNNRELAERILKYAKIIYVRDDKYHSEFVKLGIQEILTKDLSYYMKPEPVGINFKEDSIGLNISGLCYSNNYRSLAGQFPNYKKLICKLVARFQELGKTIYLIPHSYNATPPRVDDDDLIAINDFYNSLSNKDNVIPIKDNYSAPEIKYIISKMSFFIGSRMHANFAAIYTGVPLYGLAYSYKFEGAFKSNSAYDDNISLINNTSESECEIIVDKVVNYFLKKVIK